MFKLLRAFAFSIVFGALLFGLAGRWDLPLLWAYAAVFSGFALAGTLTMDPELARERFFPAAGGVDRKITRALAGSAYLAHIAVASLDVGRFHWSDTVPIRLQIAALVLFAACMAWANWAMFVNRFFSPIVRIQEERGHHLITAGPYGYVRHPGYAGAILGIPLSAIALGSWWSLVPAVVFMGAILRRVILEDAFLQDHLDGYRAYSKEVRYRLLPGIW